MGSAVIGRRRLVDIPQPADTGGRPSRRAMGKVVHRTGMRLLGLWTKSRKAGGGVDFYQVLVEHSIGVMFHTGLPALSLSVESDNYARGLYERVGFKAVRAVGGSLTMLLRL